MTGSKTSTIPGVMIWPLVELLTEIRSDERHLRTVGADTVGQIEMVDPRPHAVVGVDGRGAERQGRHTRV